MATEIWVNIGTKPLSETILHEMLKTFIFDMSLDFIYLSLQWPKTAFFSE